MKKLYLLLVLPFLLSLTSCGNGKEIDVNKAKEIYESIEEYTKGFKGGDYTKVLTSHSEIVDDGSKWHY